MAPVEAVPAGPPQALGPGAPTLAVSHPAPPAPSGSASAAAAAASGLGISLGITDPELEDLKDQAVALTQSDRNRKRPKLTHKLFFDDERGFQKILKTFPQIKFRGKGNEFADLKLLMRHYDKWFRDLHPYGEHFEDLVWKARQVLQDKEKEEDDNISDPRERLHLLRFRHKSTALAAAAPASTGGREISEEVRKKIEANRKKALELQRQRKARESGSGEAQLPPDDPALSVMWNGPTGEEDEDVFGFGFGMDDDGGASGFNGGRGGSQGAAARSSSHPPPPPAYDEEEDPFGFGGGLDDDFGPPRAAPPPVPKLEATPKEASAGGQDAEKLRLIEEKRAQALALKRRREQQVTERAVANATEATALAYDEEEEDPFGFGGGLDNDCAPSPPLPRPSAPPSAPSAASMNEHKHEVTPNEAGFGGLDAEKLRLIEEKRAQALALKLRREGEARKRAVGSAAQGAAPAPPAPPPLSAAGPVAATRTDVAEDPSDEFGMEDAFPNLPEEEDPFGFGGGLDDPW